MVLHDRRGAQMRNIIYTFNFYEPWGFVTGTSSAAGSGGSSGERSTSVATAGYRYPDEYACSVAYAGWVPLFCPQVPIIHTLQPLLEYILLRLRRLLEDKGCSLQLLLYIPAAAAHTNGGCRWCVRSQPSVPTGAASAPPLLCSSAPLLLRSALPAAAPPCARRVGRSACLSTDDGSKPCLRATRSPSRPRPTCPCSATSGA